MYRMFRNERKRKLKLLHAGIMISVFLLTVIALKAVFDSHNLAPCKNPKVEGDVCPTPNLYSLHSWMGLLTVILFLLQVRKYQQPICLHQSADCLQFFFQWLAGLITFLFPGLASHLRASYLPIHVFFGLMIFICACATALLGLTEKAIFGYVAKCLREINLILFARGKSIKKYLKVTQTFSYFFLSNLSDNVNALLTHFI